MANLMAKPEGSMWSDDQWKAIARSGDDILVAAAAGSGKTAVLVERIIRKILDETSGFSVDRLLVATFTKAAAAEMRQRIREALERELDLDPENEHIRRQLALLGRASITTLHSFCMEVIRRYYQLIPLDPGFRILNEHEADLMRQELLEELFEEKYGESEGEPGSNFMRLADWFSGERTDDALYRLVQRLYDFSRSHPWPERWLRDTAASYEAKDTEELGRTPWVHSILADARLALSGAAGLLEQAKVIALQPGGPAAYADNLEEDAALVGSLLEAVHHSPWESLYEVFRDASFGKLNSIRKAEIIPELQEQVKELREQAKKTVNELKGALFGRPAREFLRELQTAAPLMKELAETVILFGERYREAKAAKGMVDFNDLEHYCLHILRHPESEPGSVLPSDAAMEYRQQFDEVLLDEYQDTNSVQEDIVRLISREAPGNRFMVGDVKQSIYRFRLAEPGLFLDKYKSYDGGDCGEEASRPGIRIDLARNFRSRMEVVDAVNMLFRQIMNESVAEIAYDARAELVCGASYPEQEGEGGSPYKPELLLIDRSGSSAEPESGEPAEDDEGAGLELEAAEMETAQLEARAIIGKIRQMTGETGKPLMIYDKSLKSMRPVEYGDMVILLRSAMIWAPLMMEELRLAGIPAVGEQNKGYFQATEVEIMLSLLAVIDNPRQDIPLASVLRSPLVGLTEEELAQVRLCAKGTYYDALKAACAVRRTPSAAASPASGLVDGAWSLGEELEGLAEAAAGHELVTGVGALNASADPEAGADISPELGHKLDLFMGRLQRWREEARQGGLSDLIWRIYSETGYLDWISGLPGGKQRQGNLTALYDRAVRYEQDTSSRGLFRFLTFISRLRERGGDLGAASSAESHGNAVRLMTIHKSKGLEFPVVFVAGVSKNFNQQDLNAPFLMHKELGFGPKFVDEQMRVTYPTLPNLAIRRRSQLELLAEEMRVLYVALTRPKEKMILVGTVKDLSKRAGAWAQAVSHPELLLPDYLLARGRSYLDWIGPAVIRHPSAGLLRELAGLPATSEGAALSKDPSDWIFAVETPESLLQPTGVVIDEEGDGGQERFDRMKAVQRLEPVPIEEADADMDGGSAEIREAVYRKLSWVYPYEAVSGISAKTSVTEMKKLLAMQEEPSLDLVEERAVRRGAQEGLFAGIGSQSPDTDHNGYSSAAFTLNLRRPKFMEAQKLTPAERGTVYHTLMQHLPLGDFRGTQAGATAIEAQEIADRWLHESEALIAYLVEREIITAEQAAAVEPSDISRLFESEVGQQLLAAEEVWREMPFSYALPAAEAYQGLAFLEELSPQGALDRPDVRLLQDETVLVQGVVDCMFRREGKLVLLDYKTDRVLEHRGGLPALAEQYRFQLELYARALEDILGEPVHEKWLYFFDGGHGVRI